MGEGNGIGVKGVSRSGEEGGGRKAMVRGRMQGRSGERRSENCPNFILKGTNTLRERHLVHVLCSCRVHLNNASAFRTLSLSHVVVDGQVALL